MTTEVRPPVAARQTTIHELHGVHRRDDYAWLRAKDEPRVRAYLAAERAYYDAATRHLQPLTDALFDEMRSRVPPTDESVSWERGPYVYYTRTPPGRDYPLLCRRIHNIVTRSATESAVEEVLLDANTITRPGGHLDLGLTEVSPDGGVLAYSVDVRGDEVYELRFRDLATGADLPDRIPHTYYGGAWSADSTLFFYTVHNAAYRPFQIWRHRLGTATADDALVLQEDDDQFDVSVEASRTGDLVVLHSANRDTSEVWLVDAHDAEGPARCIERRRRGVEYTVEHLRDDAGGTLLIVTNDEAVEFRLMRAPLATPGRAHWVEVMPEDPTQRLVSAAAFAGHLVLTSRRDASPLLRLVPLPAPDELSQLGKQIELTPAAAAGSIRLGRNERYDAASVVVAESSFTEPTSWYDVDLATGDRRLRKRQVAPGFDPGRYLSTRTTASAPDGVEVPVTVVRRNDVPLDGSAPCLVYGYGAYESVDEPEFDPALPALLDRGVVFAYAHVRGGGEGGRRWWLDGRLERKVNTFADHLAVADTLAAGMVDGDRLATRGLSAGGLLQAAVFSIRPARWRAVVAEVPFVDVVTTMLDPSVPLTANEWDEWGDPRRGRDFTWMLDYSPYDNLPPPGGRPDLLVTGAVHDPRVMVSEPAKWVAALRASDPEWSPRCLFRCELGAGAHAGPPGRFARLRYEAEIYAWVLDRLDAATNRPADDAGLSSGKNRSGI